MTPEREGGTEREVRIWERRRGVGRYLVCYDYLIACIELKLRLRGIPFKVIERCAVPHHGFNERACVLIAVVSLKYRERI